MEQELENVYSTKMSNISHIVDLGDSNSGRSAHRPMARQFLKLPPSTSDLQASLNLNEYQNGPRRSSQNLPSSFENFSIHKLENSDSECELIDVLEDSVIKDQPTQGDKKRIVLKQMEIIDVQFLNHNKPISANRAHINESKYQLQEEEHSTHEILSYFRIEENPITESQAYQNPLVINETAKDTKSHTANEKKLVVLPKPTETSIVKRTNKHVFNRKSHEGRMLGISIGCLLVMTLVVMIYHESQFLPPNLIYQIL